MIAELKPLIQDKYTHVMEVKTTEDLKVLYENDHQFHIIIVNYPVVNDLILISIYSII